MPAWITTAIRTGVQAAWAYLATWALGLEITLPDQAPEWLTCLALALATTLVTLIIRWLETSRWTITRRLAKALMLGTKYPGCWYPQ